MNKNKLEYEERWVGYFDLLRFREIVEKYPLGYVLSDYIDALQEIYLQKQELDVAHKWFSDTFLFYTKDSSPSSFWNIENACRLFYRKMFSKRIPLRGCLSIGDFYFNEERDVLIGPALVDAYYWAEEQNWMGYVLAPNTIRRIETLDAAGQSLWEHFKSRSYAKYEVPYKKGKKGKKEKLWACTMNIYESSDNHKIKDLCRLWNALIEMETIACVDVGGRENLGENVKEKYRNTKDFMLTVFPELKKRVRDLNRQISPNEQN